MERSPFEYRDTLWSFSTDNPIHVWELSHRYRWYSLLVDSTLANTPIAKIFCNPNINTPGNFSVIHRHVHSSKKFESSDAHVPSPLRQKRWSLSSYFSSHTVNKRALQGPPSATSFIWLFAGDLAVETSWQAWYGSTAQCSQTQEGCDVPYGKHVCTR